jgi:hypothetical protein
LARNLWGKKFYSKSRKNRSVFSTFPNFWHDLKLLFFLDLRVEKFAVARFSLPCRNAAGSNAALSSWDLCSQSSTTHSPYTLTTTQGVLSWQSNNWIGTPSR